MNKSLLRLEGVQKSFTNAEGKNLLILNHVSFEMREHQITAILGKSGSGKSTLLRIISGLTKPSAGTVYYRDRPVQGPAEGISMIFQGHALFPWLTVLENVELGLEAQGLSKKERRKKSLNAIDIIGLDGFESAYPKELSGGMRQRVGFARALVMEPELLLMDEPFSALDILTAENLRNDLLELWYEKRIKTKSILLVTHDIEEAILLANNILVFNTDPGCIQANVPIDLPFPRDPEQPEFKALLDHIYTLLSTSDRHKLIKGPHKTPTIRHPEYAYRLPDVEVSEITGLLEAMEDHETQGRIDLPDLADELHLDIDSLFPLTEILDMLHFVQVSEGSMEYLPAGREFAEADILQRKYLFAKHLLRYIPLAAHIKETLDNESNHQVSKAYFQDELENYLSEEESDRLLKIMIEWGRYAEIFAYNNDTQLFSLDNPQ